MPVTQCMDHFVALEKCVSSQEALDLGAKYLETGSCTTSVLTSEGETYEFFVSKAL